MHLLQLLTQFVLLILTTAHPTSSPSLPNLNTTLVSKAQSTDIPAGWAVYCGIILQAAGGVEWQYQLQVDKGWRALSDLSCEGAVKLSHCENRYEYQSVSTIYSGCIYPCRAALDNGDLFWAYNSIALPVRTKTAVPPAPVAALCCGDCSYEP